MRVLQALFILLLLLSYSRSLLFLKRSITTPILSGSVFFGNQQNSERDHSLGEGKVSKGSAGKEVFKSTSFTPQKNLIEALNRVSGQKQSYLLLPGNGMLTKTVFCLALICALEIIVRSSAFKCTTASKSLKQIMNNGKKKEGGNDCLVVYVLELLLHPAGLECLWYWVCWSEQRSWSHAPPFACLDGRSTDENMATLARRCMASLNRLFSHRYPLAATRNPVLLPKL